MVWQKWSQRAFECGGQASRGYHCSHLADHKGVKHCCGVVGDAIRRDRGGDVWETVSESVSSSRGCLQ
jgi:hypothetical protein